MFLNKYVHSTFAYLGKKKVLELSPSHLSPKKKLVQRDGGGKNSAAMAAQAEAEEEVRLELEAVAAVYGDDVRVLRDLPPHLVVHVRPRTADDSSQQVRLASPPSLRA